MSRSSCFFVVLGLFGAMAAPARAQTMDACVAEFERGQRLRKDLHFIEAQEAFFACSRTACPKVLRADCAGQLIEVEREQPTITPGARDADGTDLSDLELTVDGQRRAVPAGGALPLDPGVHEVAVDKRGFVRKTVSIVLRVAERNRPVIVTLERAEAPAPPVVPVAAPPPATPPPTEDRMGSTSSRTVSPWVYPLASVGVLGLGSFGYFGVTGLSDRASAKDRCGPYCDPEDSRRVGREFLIADVSLAVGVVALTAAVWLYVADTHSVGSR